MGYYADDFKEYEGGKIEAHPDVPSIVDFLAIHRPIYISLLDAGAGAKNKILEAMVAGCPIICTPASLDSSIWPAPSIKIFSSDRDVMAQLSEWNSPACQHALTLESTRLADKTRQQRSWHSVSSMALDLMLKHSQ